MQLDAVDHAFPHGAVPGTPVAGAAHLHLVACKEHGRDIVSLVPQPAHMLEVLQLQVRHLVDDAEAVLRQGDGFRV